MSNMEDSSIDLHIVPDIGKIVEDSNHNEKTESTTPKVATIQSLPPEILSEILSLVPNQTSSNALVCRSFRDCISDIAVSSIAEF